MSDFINGCTTPEEPVLVMLDRSRAALTRLSEKVGAAGQLHGEGLAQSLRTELLAANDDLAEARYRVDRLIEQHAEDLRTVYADGQKAVGEANGLVDGLTYFLALTVEDVERRYRKAHRTEPSWLRSARREIERALYRCGSSTRELVAARGYGDKKGSATS